MNASFQTVLEQLRKESDWRPERGALAIAEQVEANRQAIEAHHRLLIALEEFVRAKIDLIEYKFAAKDGSK